MAYYSTVLLLLYLSWVLSFSLVCSQNDLPVKAASIGNWLLIEGWMKPSLFDGIPNKDLLDGTQVQFMSTQQKKYLSAENGGGKNLIINGSSASSSETFRLWRINETFFNLRVSNKQFVGLENEGQGSKLVAVSTSPKSSEIFQIIRKEDDKNRVHLQASNGQFLQVKSDADITADGNGSSWDDDDPSVFTMIIGSGLQGEYQLTNGYGPDKAPQIMKDHWNTYITEEDFNFMSQNGINAVRIPIGWWIMYDPNPPKPFVGGSLEALDNAFKWSEKYKLKVIVDLHGLRVSQNGFAHSASRDGFQEWGSSDIQETVDIIDFLAKRYANQPSLLAIELMNEPRSPGINLVDLKKFYKDGYDAVRKYTKDAYVIFSNRLGGDLKELISFSNSFSLVVIDIHMYNLFWMGFDNMTVQQNIDYIYNNRGSDIKSVSDQGPLIFIGEWTSEWDVKNASKEDYQKFAKAELEVYGRASFGWAYWAYKCDEIHWSLKWMIENRFIML
ncbi:hypothetical protein Patl1_27297 [Pistacia atlantica]|uniref:Uncharacterized protein n=1 Tax=Pistacia atlantica TaxID=434234 RepID=A0ACC1BE78_9ROSI|nr:hypothetical protein Patl1_27297 [Pistacia atlantica]